MYTCKTCGFETADRSELGKHNYQHKLDEIREELVVPYTCVEELKYLRVGDYARVVCGGHITDGGLKIDKEDIKFV
jgi:hypothetical protein